MNLSSFRTLLLLAGLVSMVSNAAVPSGVAGQEYAETMLLFSPKDADMRFGIKTMYKRGKVKDYTLDLLAETAWSVCSGKRKIEPDTLAWIAKTIGISKQGRYAPVIDDCLKTATNASLIRYLNEAKLELADSPKSNPFVGGGLNLEKIKADLIKNRKAIPAEPAARAQYGGLKAGLSMDEVYARLGAPEKLNAMALPKGKAGFLFVKVKLSEDRIVFHYPNLGEVRFGYEESSGNWLLADATSTKELYWLAVDGRFVTHSVAIAEGEREDLTMITKLLAKQREPIDSALLDRVADRIYLSQMESSGGMADTLAHMCKLLGKSNNGKYKQLLREVSEKAAHNTLRKYAALSADALPDTGEPPYLPMKGKGQGNT